MEMNKFTGEDDYHLVKHQLRIVCGQSDSIVTARLEGTISHPRFVALI